MGAVGLDVDPALVRRCGNSGRSAHRRVAGGFHRIWEASEEAKMKFAKIVFYTAAAIGALSAIPMYLMDGNYLYYSALAGLVAWQPVFFIIATDPIRYRPVMLAGMAEKFLWVGTLAFLYLRGSITALDFYRFTPFSLILGALFVAAHRKTRPQR
jgi:Fe2+ transport system protein B